MADTLDLSRQLEAAQRTPIAELGPELLDLATRAVRGVVTITWPYSSVKNTFAFILAEPDFRLRRNRGQVRVNLAGAAAKAAKAADLGPSDEVLLSLDGATWEAEQIKKRQSLPGTELEWQLQFAEKVKLSVKSSETGDTKEVTSDQIPTEQKESPIQTPTTEPSETIEPVAPKPQALADSLPPSIPTSTPVKNPRVTRLDDEEYASPAFIKRARLSYGSLFEGGLDLFEEDGGVKGKGRKRTRFGRDSTAWRYTSQSPSPEPVSSPLGESMTQELGSSPPAARPEMADEGCQTMELDLPPPGPISTAITPGDVEFGHPPHTATSRDTLVPHNQENMVNHGVQATPPVTWTSAASNPLLPFPSSSVLPSTRLGVDPPESGSPFGGNMEVPSEPFTHAPGISYPVGSFGTNSGFGRAFTTNPFMSLDPTRPIDHVGIAETGYEHDAHGDDILEQAQSEEHGQYEASARQSSLPVTDYPPPSRAEHVVVNPAQEETLSQYPTSFLDDNQSRHRSTRDGAFDESMPTPAVVGSSSWATVNNPFKATAVPPTDRLGRSGDSPEEAVVIDESDSDDEPAPEPTAVEDTVNRGRADALDGYEDADIEDEDDAQYSDDDEPEYDADEMGGDYDTRNYVGPDDDEDDSHDGDLAPRPVEPEFDGGEDWDEGDEESDMEQEGHDEYEDEDEDDDDDDEDDKYPNDKDMGGEEAKHQSTTNIAPQSNNMVIDLISSSEDENDENAAPAQSSPLPIRMPRLVQLAENSHVLAPGSPEYSPASEPTGENLSPMDASDDNGTSASERYASSEHSEYMDDDGEEASEDDIVSDIPVHRQLQDSSLGGIGADDAVNPYDPELKNDQPMTALRTLAGSKVLEEPPPAADTRVDSGNEKDLDGSEIQNGEPSATHRAIPQPIPGGEAPSDAGANMAVGDEKVDDYTMASVPISAADGLEMLSRAVDNESMANYQVSAPEFGEQSSTKALGEFPADPVVTDDVQMTDVPDADGRSGTASATTSTDKRGAHPSGDEEIIDLKEDKTANVGLAPSSPPMTQSFLSRRSVHEEEAAVDSNTHTEMPADQLPTPHDTQTMDDANKDLAMSVSFDDAEHLEINLQPVEAVVEKTSTKVKTTAGPNYMVTDPEFPVEVHREQQESITARTELELPPEETKPGLETESIMSTEVREATINTTKEQEITTITIEREMLTEQEQHEQVRESSAQDADPAITTEIVMKEREIITATTDQAMLSEKARGDLEPEDKIASAPPSLSFQTQVAGEEMAQDEVLEQTSRPAHQSPSQTLEVLEVTEAVASDINVSFPSQMDVDDELQASILEHSQLDDFGFEGGVGGQESLSEGEQSQYYSDEESILESSDEDGSVYEDVDQAESSEEEEDGEAAPLEDKQMTATRDDEQETESREVEQATSTQERGKQEGTSTAVPEAKSITRSSPVNEQVPAAESGNEVFVQTHEEDDDDVEDASDHDPSVELARAANASRRDANLREASSDISRPHTRSQDQHKSSSPAAADRSVELARASLAKPIEPEDESFSMTEAKLALVRHLRDELPDCTSLKVLRQHLTKTLDVMAVVMMKPPEPRRAKGGPREYMMSFTITDHSIGPTGPPSVAEVLIYRPHKESLPKVKEGDVILLRNFTVVSLTNKGFGLNSNETSAWAVFDAPDSPPQIKGPPVEYGDKETRYVELLRAWYALLDDKAREQLERANQKIIDAGSKGK
ncbi:hypothetical protein F4780DRAFT_728734 [Xylariomycetidae sp. FL0641]|nr:hypothetical protein F4780DRAFT_728734 [Xylariomycetidae sp. FL0641]